MRWTICALLFFATTINYMDRQILGLLAPTLQEKIGWSEAEYGHIVTAFQAAYALGLLVFGQWIDRIGTKRGYAVAVTVWSLAAMGHALVRSVFGFGLARTVLGLGEAGNFPAAIKAVAEWFPPRQRALATGIFNSGANVGAILAPLLVPPLTLHYGWEMSFIVLGATGFLWIGPWLMLYRKPPEASPAAAAGTAAPADKVPAWPRLLAYRQTWVFIVGVSFTAPIWWFYLYWLPKFLNKQYDLDLVNLGLPLVVIYSMTCVGSLAGGWLSSHLLARGWSVTASRKTALLVCAVSVVPVAFAQTSSLWTATLLIGLAAAAHQGWSANLYTVVSDMFPKKAVASVVGLGSMFGAVAAMGFAQMTGMILGVTGSYWSLFLIASSAYLAAWIIMHLLLPRLVAVELDEAGD